MCETIVKQYHKKKKNYKILMRLNSVKGKQNEKQNKILMILNCFTIYALLDHHFVIRQTINAINDKHIQFSLQCQATFSCVACILAFFFAHIVMESHKNWLIVAWKLKLFCFWCGLVWRICRSLNHLTINGHMPNSVFRFTRTKLIVG